MQQTTEETDLWDRKSPKQRTLINSHQLDAYHPYGALWLLVGSDCDGQDHLDPCSEF